MLNLGIMFESMGVANARTVMTKILRFDTFKKHKSNPPLLLGSTPGQAI